MKKHKYPFLIALAVVFIAIGFFVVRQNSQSSTSTESSYNPNYADAVQRRKPELCHNIRYALQSGPTDSIDQVYGDKAVKVCEAQAKTGVFSCECDSDALLNGMRKH